MRPVLEACQELLYNFGKRGRVDTQMDIDKALFTRILEKRKNSEPLDDREEAYARKLFDAMMTSKPSLHKVVRVVSGEQLRKAKTDAEPTKKDPRYTEGKNPSKIGNDNPNPKAEQLKGKVADADEKPKAGPAPGYEQDRLNDMLQEKVPPRSEATSKFTAVDPVNTGDLVVKNIAKSGTLLVQGRVLKVKDGVAMVKWSDGRTMTEVAHLLVKAKKKEDDPKLGVSESEEEAKNPPMSKGEMSPKELEEAKRLAERMKGKKDIDNPHALARWMVQRKFSKAAQIAVLGSLAKADPPLKNRAARAARTVRQTARRVGGEVQSAMRRGRAVRGLQQVQRQPAKHRRAAVGTAVRSTRPPNVPKAFYEGARAITSKNPKERQRRLGRAARALTPQLHGLDAAPHVARWLGSRRAAREARGVERNIRSQYGLTGAKPSANPKWRRRTKNAEKR